MRFSKLLRATAVMCAAFALTVVLGGCTAQSNEQETEQAANRAYMSQVNQIMDDLDDRLESFEAAVSRGDTVTMRTQADNAMKALDKLGELEVPEVVEQVHEGYVQGSESLKDALNAYVQLYTDIDSQGDSFDYSTYDERLAEIQSAYDEGVAKLEEADKKATEL